MAMLIKNKNMAFSLILMCLMVVSPMAKAQLGGLLSGPSVINIQGAVMCSINGSVATNATSIPFAGARVLLQCAGQNITTTTTDANGVFSFSPNLALLNSLSALLSSGCRVIVTTPLSACNANLPTNSVLMATVNLAGTILTGGINILQFVNGLFRLI
ncbi:unnamed protein product [Eruca vesicaria subsp. sativa]|uniref:Phylloplanin n=1 Tax=Eruca vesicaria subsp. sativa TaxID=29727 RepID=A0ABC8JS03_ERUVS|nr:unnamed protein product [Eruca vesicaria subsp. sativa]